MTTETTAPPDVEEMAAILADLSTYPHDVYAVKWDAAADDYEQADNEVRYRVELGPEAQVISSAISGQADRHTFMADIDHPVELMAQASTTAIVITVPPADPWTSLGTQHADARELLTVLQSVGIADQTALIDPDGEPLRVMFRSQHRVRLVATSTPGHHHLFIDAPLSWGDLATVLDRMAVVGIVEPNYAAVSRNRFAAHLRLPWVRKADAR